MYGRSDTAKGLCMCCGCYVVEDSCSCDDYYALIEHDDILKEISKLTDMEVEIPLELPYKSGWHKNRWKVL